MMLSLIAGMLLVNKALADETVVISGRFYQQDIILFPSEEITYFKVGICDQSQHSRMVVSLSQPYNVAWDVTRGNIYVEISTQKDSWTEETVFATNYVQDNENGRTIFYKNITVGITDVNFQDEEIFIRIKGAGVQTTATWEITFDAEDEITNGQYDPYTFNENIPPSSTVWNTADQYARTSNILEVDNENYVRLVFAFCAGNFPYDKDSDWGMTITIVGDPYYPESGFNVYACPTTWEIDYCSVTKYIDHDDDAISVVTATIRNNEQGTSINDGAVAAVLGIGGSGKNYFSATAAILPPTTTGANTTVVTN